MSLKVPQYQSTVRVTDQPVAASRDIQVPESAFKDYLGESLIEVGGMVSSWAEKKMDLKAKSESAAAGSQLNKELDELVRAENMNPNPHLADANVKLKSEQLYHKILQSKFLSGNRSRSLFTSEHSAKLGEKLSAFRTTNDQKILAFQNAITNEKASLEINGVLDGRTSADRWNHAADLLGVGNTGGHYSLSTSEIIMANINGQTPDILEDRPGIYEQAFVNGEIPLEEFQEKQRLAAINLYEGIAMQHILGATDPTAAVIGLEQDGTLGDPLHDVLGKKIDPVAKAEIIVKLLNKAEAMEKGRMDQDTQNQSIGDAENLGAYHDIFNTESRDDALNAFNHLKSVRWFDPTSRNAVENHLKRMGWNTEPGAGAGFRSSEQGSEAITIRIMEKQHDLGNLTPEVVGLYADMGLLTQADYKSYMRDATRIASDAEKWAIEHLKDRFRYNEFADTETEMLGNLPMMAFMETKTELREFVLENPSAAPNEIRDHAKTLVDRKQTEFKQSMKDESIIYLNSIFGRLFGVDFEFDPNDVHGSLNRAAQEFPGEALQIAGIRARVREVEKMGVEF